MADAHAVLSASSSKMWIACPPAARLNAAAADISSEYAQQGSSAHQLAEFKVKHSLGCNVQDPTESLTYFDNEMADCKAELPMNRVIYVRDIRTAPFCAGSTKWCG